MRRWIDNDAELNAALYMQYMPDDMKQLIFNDEREARRNSEADNEANQE